MCQVWQETGRAAKFQNMRSKEKSKKPGQRRKLSVSHKGGVMLPRLSQEAKTTVSSSQLLPKRAGRVQGRGAACRLGSASGSPRLRYWPDPQTPAQPGFPHSIQSQILHLLCTAT